DVNVAELDKTAELLKQTGRPVLAECFDIRDAARAKAFVDRAAATYGRVDILVNNAAIMPVASVEESSDETIGKILDVNLKAPILLSKYVTPHLRAAGGGAIIHMASVQGHLGHASTVVYSATKGALIQLARSQAMELAKDRIRVNTVSPGCVDAPML